MGSRVLAFAVVASAFGTADQAEASSSTERTDRKKSSQPKSSCEVSVLKLEDARAPQSQAEILSSASWGIELDVAKWPASAARELSLRGASRHALTASHAALQERINGLGDRVRSWNVSVAPACEPGEEPLVAVDVELATRESQDGDLQDELQRVVEGVLPQEATRILVVSLVYSA